MDGRRSQTTRSSGPRRKRLNQRPERSSHAYSPNLVERLSGKSVGGASTRLDRSPTTRKYGLFTPLRGPCSPGSVPVGTFQTVSPHSQVNKGERMSGREILAAVRAPCPYNGDYSV